MQKLKSLHRTVMLLVVIWGIWFSVSGVLMQSIDVRSWLVQAPGTDPNMISLRESFNGPPNYEVIGPEDYAAAALPLGANLNAMIIRTFATASSLTGSQPLRFVELRMVDGKPQGLVDAKPSGPPRVGPPKPTDPKSYLVRVDPTTGAVVSRGLIPGPPFGSSFRNQVKGLHTMGFLQFGSAIVNVLVGLGFATMIVTGVMIYLKMLRARSKNGRKSLFWNAGGVWRTTHRAIAMIAAVFLTIIVVSGTYISFEGLYFRTAVEIYKARHNGTFDWGPGSDASSPLQAPELPAMLRSTLAAQRAQAPNLAVKVIRLRYYGGMPQGVVVAGQGNDTQQFVYNTSTGQSVLETEPGYPEAWMPFGWQVHQWAKQVHRGDYLALPGKTVSGHLLHLLAGLSLFYLSVSGLVVYSDIWKAQRARKKKQAQKEALARSTRATRTAP